MKRLIRISLVISILALFLSPLQAQMDMKTNSSKSEQLRMAMHKLWEDHIVWTRNVILNIMDDLPGTDQAVNRLLKNQDDIGNAVKPFYGEAGGKELTRLLREHITIAADLLKAAKAGNNSAFDAANKKWFVNADEISDFLSKANPNWKLADMKKMMHDHLTLTTEEAVARLKKDYAADVKAYDKVHDEILMMADMLTDGIIKQFPGKF
ncbi:MAG TPA: hypothetical protein VIU35_15290 [Chitinophagaceae bacterium]